VDRVEVSGRGRWAALIVVTTGLSYLCYRALIVRSVGDGRMLPVQAAILVTLVIVYAYRCVRILRVRRPSPATGARFIGLSLMFMAALLLSFACFYRETGLVPAASSPSSPGGSPCREAGTCLYFAVVICTTVGYGDYASTPAARPYAALEALLGYFFMAFFIPTLIHAMTGPASDNVA
jgi:hypothetical protein